MISGEKSKLPDVLERVRQEKDALEKENAALQQRANATACENERLRDQISVVQDELMVSRRQVSGDGPDVRCLKCGVVHCCVYIPSIEYKVIFYSASRNSV